MIALNITHGDDNAVAVLAMAMVSKLAQARAKGRSGWDTAECTQQHLSDLLREHVAKGDPVDVANFCAFLTARGEGIAGAAPAAFRPGKPGADVEVAWLLMRSLAGDGEGGSDETDTVVLALRADDEQWFVAGDWRANSALDYVHHDGGWIVGWMPYEVPAARLSAAPQAPAAPVDEQSARDSICAWSVWWTHNKAKFTTPRQAALAAWNQANERALRAMAAPAAPSTHAGLLAAAAHIQAKAQAHLDERGSYDPDTGAIEMSESNQEHFNTLDELAEEIQLMADKAAPASCDKPPAGWTCSRAPGHEGPCAAAPAAPAVDALDAVRQAVRDYHYDLDMRRHGDIAACNAIDAIQAALGMAWTQGAEAAARAAQAATTGQPAK